MTLKRVEMHKADFTNPLYILPVFNKLKRPVNLSDNPIADIYIRSISQY